MSLVEVVLALTLLGIVMMTSLAFILRALTSTNGQSQRQAAASLAAEALDRTRSVPTPVLVRGRTAAAVAALRASGTTTVNTSIDDTSSADAVAATTDASGGALTVPTSTTATVSGTTYTVKTFIEVCWLTESGSGATTTQQCGATRGSTSRMTYRITTEVTWPRPAGTGCAGPNASTCAYSTSTLRDATPRAVTYQEPVFPSTLTPPVLGTPSPATFTAASTTTNVTMSATGLKTGASVSENGTGTISNVTVTGTSVSFTFTADITSGTYQFSVTNPDGGTATSPGSFTVTQSVPTISGLSGTAYQSSSPCRYIDATSYCTFTLTGSSFFAKPDGTKPGISFSYPGAALQTLPPQAITVTDSGTLRATVVPPSPGTTAVTIYYTNPDGGSVTTTMNVTVGY